MQVYKAAVILCLTVLLCPLFAGAQDTLQQRLESMDSRLAELERRSRTQQKEIAKEKEVTQALFKWGLSGLLLVQSANHRNTGDGSAQADPNYLLNFTVSKKFDDVNAEVYTKFKAGLGEGLDGVLELYSYMNDTARDDNDIIVDQIWYKQFLFGEFFSFQFGKLKASANFDGNQYATDSKTQFVSGIFVNSPTVEFSDRDAGIKLAVYPYDWLEVSYGFFDSSGDWADLTKNLFNIGEITLYPKIFGRRGAYRFMAWNNTANHTKWSDPAQTNKAAYGFSLSFDQDLTNNIGLFARYGWQDPTVFDPARTTKGGLEYSLSHAWSAGAQINGAIWGRSTDFAGIAVGQVLPSSGYKNATDANGDTETHVEAYYNIGVNKHFSLTPSFQYIKNPFGNDIDGMRSSIAVLSVRGYFTFD